MDHFTSNIVQQREVPLQHVAFAADEHRHVAAAHEVHPARQGSLEEIDAGALGERAEPLDLLLVSLRA